MYGLAVMMTISTSKVHLSIQITSVPKKSIPRAVLHYCPWHTFFWNRRIEFFKNSDQGLKLFQNSILFKSTFFMSPFYFSFSQGTVRIGGKKLIGTVSKKLNLKKSQVRLEASAGSGHSALFENGGGVHNFRN